MSSSLTEARSESRLESRWGEQTDDRRRRCLEVVAPLRLDDRQHGAWSSAMLGRDRVAQRPGMPSASLAAVLPSRAAV